MEVRQRTMEGMVTVPDPAFWKNRRVFITGHTGFKGGWLSLWLQKMGAHVIGYALNPPTVPNFFDAASVKDNMTSITGDIRDLESLKKSMAGHSPDIVIHMAAQALVLDSYASPAETYETNIMGTVNVLEAVRHTDGVRVLINVTSDKCYENREWVWGYRESDPVGGHDPYSSSKGCAELVTAAYRKSFFDGPGKTAVATVRAGNVIGGGDWAKDRLVPDIIRAMTKQQSVMIRNPGAVRPWQFVLEPLSGYLMLAERLWDNREDFSGSWNFGPDADNARPVSWLAEKLTEIWGAAIRVQYDAVSYPHEACYLRLDCSRARMLLHWMPRISLQTTLNWAAEWYLEYYDKGNARNITEAQIERFEAMQ